MATLPAIVELTPREEAIRIWRGAQEAFGNAEFSLVALTEALDLGVRTVEILIVDRLHPVRDKFPATISGLLEEPAAEVDPTRDAELVPRTLQFIHGIDLLSENELGCVSPGLHRGWEDRMFSCERSRKTAQTAIGISLDAATRESLMLLVAYRNRVLRVQPPVNVVVADIVEAFPALEMVVERLFDRR